MNRRGSTTRSGRLARLGAWLGIGLGLATFGGGCSPSAEDICDLKCNCEGCSDKQYDDCVADIEDTTAKAKEYGCEDEYGDWLGCIDKEAECRSGDEFAWDGCDIEEDALDGVRRGRRLREGGEEALRRMQFLLLGSGSRDVHGHVRMPVEMHDERDVRGDRQPDSRHGLLRLHQRLLSARRRTTASIPFSA